MENILPQKERSTDYVKHSDKMKAKAVREYMKLGNLALVARKLDINYLTLQSWRYRTQWWPELQKRFQEESDRKLASKMEEVVAKAIDQIEERIDTGDKILDSKSGEVISVPVKTRDLTAAVKTLSDRSDVLIGRATKDSIAKEMMSDKLAKLAHEFAQFTKGKTFDGTTGEELSPQADDGFMVLDDEED
jgi:signal recognition particle subunit SEC65